MTSRPDPQGSDGDRDETPGGEDTAKTGATAAGDDAATGKRAAADDDPAPSIIDSISARTGRSARVHLPDEGSAHAASPLIDASSPAARELPEGRGHYQVLGEIARGGMGAILKSHDTDLGRDVAMKVLLEQHSDSDAIIQRFVEEAQIGGQLQHPGIVPVYELGLMADERPYFTMKLVKGRTLAKLLAGRGDAADGRRRFLSIFEKVCETMGYAHARNVIHRDLKPANIMVGAFGEVQVVDWGLAKVLTEGGVSDERVAQQTQVSIIETVRSGSSSGGTESLVGSIMGTPAYMPPEQAQGQVDVLDERADVFALGAILCEILTGRPPYIGEHDSVVTEAAKAMQDGARRRLESCGADAELVELALDCMAPARATRPADAGVVLERVHANLATQEQRTRDAEVAAAQAAERATQERKARRLTLALAATVLVAVLGGAGGYLYVEQRDAARRDQTVREVVRLLEEAGVQREQGDFDGALEACARADAVLAAGTPDAELADRVARARQRAESGAEGVRLERERAARIANFVRELDGIVFGQSFALTGDRVQRFRSGRFEQAFADFGLDPLGPDADATLAALRETGETTALVLALDEWARLTRNTKGWRHADARHLSDLADRLDDDPVRARIRAATTNDDNDALRAIVREADATGWPPTTVAMAYFALRDLGIASQAESMLRACQRSHPTDASINHLLASYLETRSPEPRHEIVRFLSAAMAARPGNAVAANELCHTLFELDRDDEAIETYLAAVRRNPDDVWLAGGLTLDGILSRVDVGRREDLARRTHEAFLAAGSGPDHEGIAAWFLVASSDPARRDAARAVELTKRVLAELPEANEDWNTLGVAQYLVGDWQDAVASMEASIRFRGEPVDSDLLVIALSLDELGQHDVARAWYEQALALRPAPQDENRLMGEIDFLWEDGERRFGG